MSSRIVWNRPKYKLANKLCFVGPRPTFEERFGKRFGERLQPKVLRERFEERLEERFEKRLKRCFNQGRGFKGEVVRERL